MKSVAQVRIISAVKVCRNRTRLDFNKIKPTPAPPHLPLPPPTAPPSIQSPHLFGAAPTSPPIQSPSLFGFGGLQLPELNNRPTPTFLSYFGNPCLDLFFRLVHPDTPAKQADNRNYLNNLLPLAWSHNPLTTLKLICTLLYSPWSAGRPTDRKAFLLAASWLHRHHPKTLACNLAAIAGEFCSFEDVLCVLYRALQGDDADMGVMTPGKIEFWLREPFEDTEEMIAMAKKAVEKYETDSDYRFLHDRVSDLYADCLRCDIERFNQLKLKLEKQSDAGECCLEITTAAIWCPYVDSLFDCTTLLCECIAKKVFPRISEDETEHAERAREMLMKEVVLPLEKPLEEPVDGSATNVNGYHFPARSGDQPCRVEKYMKEVKSGGDSKIKADYLLPHEVVACVRVCNELCQAADLHWKTMVKDVYLKQGKFKDCLAVCDVSESMMRVPMDVSVGLGLLVSELSEEPWNGKVITFNRNPQLLSVQGHHLRSKCAFVRTMDGQDWHCAVDFQKVFDLILEVAVKGSLKPEQMIKRLFVFTIYDDFNEISEKRWETEYEAIKRKFKTRGYVVPHLVVLNLRQEKCTAAVPCTQPGVTMLSGFMNNSLVKSFLENGGDIGPDHVMEAALSEQEYQALVVVD